MLNKTQLVVQTDKNAIKWLESIGYRNSQHLPDNYGFSVFIVDAIRKKSSARIRPVWQRRVLAAIARVY